MNKLFLIGLILLSWSCKSVAPVQSSSNTVVREVVIEKLNDTTIILPPDSAWLKAWLECDSVGNVLLTKISQQGGTNIRAPTFALKNNELKVINVMDSLSVYLSYKTRYTSRDSSHIIIEKPPPEINQLTKWQQVQINIGRLSLLLALAFGIHKFKTFFKLF